MKNKKMDIIGKAPKPWEKPVRQTFKVHRDDTPGTYIKPPTPERNDPCPCKSGKKYKKCCLGK